MAGLCWMAVTLAFFLSAENTLAVDQNRLATFVNGILGKYGAEGMFSLAVSIPEDLNQKTEDILNKVYESDPSDKVLEKINNNEVYVGNRVVAAKVLKRDTGADHAESRVVGRLNDLFNPDKKNDLLLFYDYASPCVEKCTSQTRPESILEKTNDLNKWNSHAFVFSKIFNPSNGPSNTEEELRGALTQLGSVVSLGNIFRCDNKAGRMQCISCSNNGQVTPACVSDDDSQPGPSRSQPQQGSTGVAQGAGSRSGRYKRSAGWSRGKRGKHSGGFSLKAGWSRGKGGKRSGGLSVKAGWSRGKGGKHSGGFSLKAGWSRGKGGKRSGGLSVKAGWSRGKGGKRSGGLSVKAGWSRGKGGKRNRG